MILSLNGISKHFGSFQALDDVCFTVAQGEIFGIAGPNGAGKSTLLNACTGLIRPDRGKILFDGIRTEQLPPHRLCRLGLARTFQIPQVFESLTVRENIETGAIFGTRLSRSERGDLIDQVAAWLELQGYQDMPAGSVDLLTRKMIMLGAALATQPKMICMDEPFGGLNSDEIDRFVQLVLTLQDTLGITFVVVEHKMRALTRMSNRLLILDFGRVLCLETPEIVLKDKRVIDVYLGASGNA